MLMEQVLADFYNCSDRLRDEDAVVHAARESAVSVGATIVGEVAVRYVPHGLTVGVFLAESHILLSTWPEHRLLLADILLCNPNMDTLCVVDSISRLLCPHGRFIVHKVERLIAASMGA